MKHDPFTGDDAQPAAGTRGDLPDPLERILPDDGAVAGRSPRGSQQQGAVLALDPGQAPQQVSGGSRDAHTGLGGVESDIESDVDGDVVGRDGQRGALGRTCGNEDPAIGPQGMSDERGRRGGVDAVGRYRGAPAAGQKTPGHAPGTLHDVGNLNGRHTLTFLPCCRTWGRVLRATSEGEATLRVVEGPVPC